MYDYPPPVRWTIDQHDPRSWRDSAHRLNASAPSPTPTNRSSILQLQAAVLAAQQRWAAAQQALVGALAYIEQLQAAAGELQQELNTPTTTAQGT